MPKYLLVRDIRHAVTRLGASSAQGRLCEFLIGMRTLKLAGQPESQIAESIPKFVLALDELTKCLPSGTSGAVENPYYNPFGAKAGYRSPKFVSNGPSNTMHGWGNQADSPFELNIQKSPKAISRRTLSQAQLRKFLLLKDGEGRRPRLIDTAVWYYRAADVELVVCLSFD